jgi:hypothetical protein
MPGLSIGEIAAKTSLRPSAIRYYKKIRLLPKPMRVNGRRYYGESTAEHLAIIHFVSNRNSEGLILGTGRVPVTPARHEVSRLHKIRGGTNLSGGVMSEFSVNPDALNAADDAWINILIIAENLTKSR